MLMIGERVSDSVVIDWQMRLIVEGVNEWVSIKEWTVFVLSQNKWILWKHYSDESDSSNLI